MKQMAKYITVGTVIQTGGQYHTVSASFAASFDADRKPATNKLAKDPAFDQGVVWMTEAKYQGRSFGVALPVAFALQAPDSSKRGSNEVNGGKSFSELAAEYEAKAKAAFAARKAGVK